MFKTKTRYVCQVCGSAQPKWQGKCPDCGEWNTLVETVVQEPAPGRPGARPSPAAPPRRSPCPTSPRTATSASPCPSAS